MLLSSFWRAVSFTLVSAGLLQIATEWLCWRMASSRADGRSASPRSVERHFLAAALFARLAPWAVSLLLLTPAYLRGEDNLRPEHVSLPCCCAAAAIAAWIAAPILRVLVRLLHTRRFCRGSIDSGRTAAGYAILSHRNSRSLMAVAGLFRPYLLVSESLLTDGRVSSPALAVALDHEAAHARHRDNLKLLLLALLPGLPFATPARASLASRWRLAAELAADAESTQRDPQRSVLLAALLVQLAREHSAPPPAALAALLSAPQHLRIRVEHLLQLQHHAVPDSQRSPLPHRRAAVPYLLAAACLAAVAALSVAYGHRAAEMLLHLGS